MRYKLITDFNTYVLQASPSPKPQSRVRGGSRMGNAEQPET